MLALISPAKTMRSDVDVYTELTSARFAQPTAEIASAMLSYSAPELESIFKVSPAIATQLRARFLAFHDPLLPATAAIDAYDGVVYKHLKGDGLTAPQREYLQQKVRISSLLYGLLRPLDGVKPYRMEGFVRLSGTDSRIDNFWRDYQTQTLIDDVMARGGELLYLASAEERNAFHWREVKKQVRVIDFQFLQPKGDKLRQVVVYTKMARGEMIRFMMENNLQDPEQLKAFEWGGYRYNHDLSTTDTWVWLMDC